MKTLRFLTQVSRKERPNRTETTHHTCRTPGKRYKPAVALGGLLIKSYALGTSIPPVRTKWHPPTPPSTRTVSQTYPTGLLCSDLGGLSCPVPSSGTAAAQTVHTAPLPEPRAGLLTPGMCSPGEGGAGGEHLLTSLFPIRQHTSPLPLPCIPPPLQ